MKAKYIEMEGVHKVYSVFDEHGNHYYVQEMPGYWNMGRDYAVMKNRKRYYAGRFRALVDAKRWLLQQLLRDLDQPLLDL